ncbi:MAG: GNAT family N-acetyltransferase [Ignavibacteria bacterium]|nr:GNAT family N-acetyltransferase [Ignavibacteria bacterium]
MNKLEHINIRKATLKDAKNLAVLLQQVWIATYATVGIREEFSDYVLSAFTPDKVLQTLQNKSTYMYVAVKEHHIIGCVEINVQNEPPIEGFNGAEISVLYLLECFTRQGIGSALLNHAVSECIAMGYDCVWLTVFHENERALRFYHTHHFLERGNTFFEMNGNRYENRILQREFLPVPLITK